MRFVAMAALGLALGGCVSHDVIREGRIPQQREPHDRDYANNGDVHCRRTPNTDDYMDCVRKETQRDTWLDPRPMPPPKAERGPARPVSEKSGT